MGNHFEDKRRAEKERAKAEHDRKVKEYELEGTIKKLFEIKEGRDYFLHLIEKGGIFQTSMTGNSTTFFNEGRRAFALEVVGELSAACPNEIAKLFGEFYERSNSDRTD